MIVRNVVRRPVDFCLEPADSETRRRSPSSGFCDSGSSSWRSTTPRRGGTPATEGEDMEFDHDDDEAMRVAPAAVSHLAECLCDLGFNVEMEIEDR